MAGKYILGRVSQNRARVAKYVLTEAGLFLAVMILQTTVLAKLKPLGVVPDLTYATLLLIAYFCGKETGAVTGIAAGFVLDAIGSLGISILPVCYLICGYVCGYFTRAILPRRFTAFLVVMGAAVPVRVVITLVTMAMTYREIHLLEILIYVLLPEMLTTFLAAVLLYFPMKKLCEWLNK